MAIYTRQGAPVQIMKAEKRKRWWARYRGRTETFDNPPTAAQRKRALEVCEFEIWWIVAKQTGPYPDGSGADRVGKTLEGTGASRFKEYRDENDFRADDGIREIHAECEGVVLKAREQFRRELAGNLNRAFGRF